MNAAVTPVSESDRYTVWINTQTHIASFHPIDGYQSQSFHLHEFFMSYLCSLQESGNRQIE